MTGLLLNVQRPPDQTPFKGTLDEWKVVDPLGEKGFQARNVQREGAEAPTEDQQGHQDS